MSPRPGGVLWTLGSVAARDGACRKVPTKGLCPASLYRRTKPPPGAGDGGARLRWLCARTGCASPTYGLCAVALSVRKTRAQRGRGEESV